MKKLLFSFLLLITAWATASAYDFMVGGIAYNKNSDGKSVTVTYTQQLSLSNYSGLSVANIPATVTYNGTTYSVTSIGEDAFEFCSGLTSVTIPNSVTSIGGYAFWDCSGLTSVTIPNSVTEIGNGAFYGCSGLASETIPNSVTEIGNGAFYGCSGLTSVTIPNSVTSIGGYAFFGCSGLISVTIGNSVTSIGECAFRDCSGLTSVTIGNSVTSIGDEAFYGCSRILEVTSFAETPPAIQTNTFDCTTYNYAILNVPISKNVIYSSHPLWSAFLHINDGTTISAYFIDSISGLLFNILSEEDATVEIAPGRYDGNTYVTSGLSTVSYNGKTYSIVALGKECFKNQKFIVGTGTAWFDAGINYIDSAAFEGTTFLSKTEATLGGSNTLAFRANTITWHPKAFVGNLLGNFQPINDTRFLNISETGSLGNTHRGILMSRDKSVLYIFPGEKRNGINRSADLMTSYAFLAQVTTIGDYAFSGNGYIKTLTWPSNLQTIGEEAFSHTVLTSFTVPATVTTLGPGFIAGNKNISAIGVVADNTAYKAVDGCVYTIDGDTLVAVPASVSSLTIPEGVTTIVAKADLDGSLTKVTIPSTVATIGSEAFIGNPNITTIYCRAVNPPTGGVFEPEVYENGTLVIPEGAEDAYRADPNWGKFLTIHNDINDSPTGIAGKYLDAGVDGNGCNTCHYITIEDGTTEGSVTLSGFFGTTEKINGTYDAETGLLTIAAKQILLVDGGNVQLSLLDSKYKASDDIVLKFDQTGNATLTNGEGYGTILDNNGALSVYSPDNKWVLRQCKGLFKTNGTIDNYRVEKFGDGVVAKDTTKFETAFVLNANQKSGTVYGFDGYTWQAFTIDSCSNVTFTQADVFYYNSSYGNGRFVNGYRWGYLDYGITGTIDMGNGIITTDPWTTLMRDTSGVSYIAAYNGDKEKSVITFPVTGTDGDDTIPGDLNGDGAVDVLDLDIVIDGVLRGEGADVNNDGRTDIMDVDQVINAILNSK